MKRLLVVMLVILCTIPLTQAQANFHGDEQRAGNFTSERILPALAWKTELTGLVGASPVYWNGHIFVTNWYGWGDWNGGLYSLNATTGSIEWRNSQITGASSVAVIGNSVVVGSLSGYLYFVNATSGVIEKSYQLETSPSWWGIASSPLAYNNTIYVVTFSNGTLWAINDSGILWKFTTGNEVSHYTSPSAYNGRIFFAGNDSVNRLYCLNENGVEIWNFSVDSQITNTPAIGYNKVFFATKSRLYALNMDGSLAWSVSFNGTMSTAAIAYGNIYIGSYEGKLYCFNATNGAELWNFTANGKIDSSPAVAGGIVYFATNNPQGTIYAVDAFSGNMLWYYRLTPPAGNYYNIMSSPYIANNRLYIGADSGYLYCFNSSGLIEVNVTLYPGKLSLNIGNKTYQVNKTSALSALHFASTGGKTDGAEISFNYTLDDSWYATWGSLFVPSILGISNTNTLFWMYWVNDTQPSVGVNLYDLNDGDIVYFTYGPWTSTLSNATITLKINVEVKSAGISSFTVSSGTKGGSILTWLNVTSLDSGWFVAVVSGTNDGGEALAGIATYYATANQEVKVPVLIHVPQQVQSGSYKLYAGIYRLNEYPNNLLAISDYAVSEVS
ncbi:WD40-like repeat protein [Archaeoglobus sulfaticallidus PM70-1]|uniref:WD40-like repeat protein n=1 Tax=Archaeoglobus sulfaticallidus PM70-1 TaxID=387631 RepID=N0BD39_9EURY|nr:PQQ-binding-like beta-propeller repeat protein [Archaeoglobus sulfaticallidus]AGK60928.1 WD40-like repeat protein [Archaeoglobus sulfaticallidus PM70-1]